MAVSAAIGSDAACFKGHSGRNVDDGPVVGNKDVLGKRSAASAKVFVAGFELGNLLADGRDNAGKVHP